MNYKMTLKSSFIFIISASLLRKNNKNKLGHVKLVVRDKALISGTCFENLWEFSRYPTAEQ